VKSGCLSQAAVLPPVLREQDAPFYTQKTGKCDEPVMTIVMVMHIKNVAPLYQKEAVYLNLHIQKPPIFGKRAFAADWLGTSVTFFLLVIPDVPIV
jgi:hypothetical protein